MKARELRVRAEIRRRIRSKRREFLFISRTLKRRVREAEAQGEGNRAMVNYNDGLADGLRTSARFLREIEKSL
jgi:hypothetical protein